MSMRKEYPRPSFVRDNWVNLNGSWEFYIDESNSGVDRKLFLTEKFDGKINVPFCPECKLSGIEHLDFIASCWYAKNINFTAKDLENIVLIHFGACDYITTLYVNGKEVGKHVGGYTSFTFDISEFLTEGENRIIVHATDDLRNNLQPSGKQSKTFYSKGCDYSRTTGIWQTVWLEYLPKNYIKKVKVNATDLAGKVLIETTLNKYVKNAELKADVRFDGKEVLSKTFALGGVVNSISFDVPSPKLWSTDAPNLYDIDYTLIIDGKDVDFVKSYFGIRRIDIDGFKVRINGKSVFQRLILDQGFYPDGIYTAPSDEELKNDILMSMALGFNGARMHEKVFEERYLYYADKLGYLIWGEFPNWGLDVSHPMTLHSFVAQWLESMDRDYNHPALIGWCPYNETWDFEGRRQIDTNVSAIFAATKAADSTRPVIDTSGNYHTENTDIFDVHDYEQNPEIYKERYEKHCNGDYFHWFSDRQKYNGKIPYFVSEYGGILWNESQRKDNDAQVSWGYGEAPKSPEEFVDRYCKLTKVLLDSKNIMGFCYTQLTDVEQEQNGLYYYNRDKKFTDELYAKIRETNVSVAEIEKE